MTTKVMKRYDDNKGDDKNNTKRNKCRQTQRRGGEAVEEERDGVEVLRQGIIFLVLLIKVMLSDICNSSPYLTSCSSTSLTLSSTSFPSSLTGAYLLAHSEWKPRISVQGMNGLQVIRLQDFPHLQSMPGYAKVWGGSHSHESSRNKVLTNQI